MRTRTSPFGWQDSFPTGEVGDELAEATNNNRLRVEEVHTTEQQQGEVPLEAGLLEEPSPNEHLRVGGRLVHFKDRRSFSPWAQSIVSKGLEWSWKDGKPFGVRQFFQRPTPLLLNYGRDLLSKSVVKKIRRIKLQDCLFCVSKQDTNRKKGYSG